MPPATSSSCSSLIDSGLLVSSLIWLGVWFGFWLWFSNAALESLEAGIWVQERVVLSA